MTDTLLRESLDVNTKIYNRLKAALRLNLRRQIFIAVCDDLVLRDRLADHLQKEVTYAAISARRQGQLAEARRLRIYPRLVTLRLDLADPNPINQMSQWLRQFPPPAAAGSAMPAFQLLGIEQLSRQPASSQWLFLNYLQGVERSLPALESSLLLWVPRPWARMIPQSAPDFWRCRTAVFEFEGDPTPLPIAALPQSTVPASIFLQPQRQSPLPPAGASGASDLSPDEVALLKSELAVPPLPDADSTPSNLDPAALPPSGSTAGAIAAAADHALTGAPSAANGSLEGDSVAASTPPEPPETSGVSDSSARPTIPPLDETSGNQAPATQPPVAQTEDLSQALRNLLAEPPHLAEDAGVDSSDDASISPSADPEDTVDLQAEQASIQPVDAAPLEIPPELQSELADAVSSEASPAGDISSSDVSSSDQASSDQASNPFSPLVSDSGTGIDDDDIAATSEAIAEDDDAFSVTLGLPPLTDTFTLDDLDLFDPVDPALSEDDTPPAPLGDPTKDSPTEIHGDALDNNNQGEGELEIVDAPAHYVYSGTVDPGAVDPGAVNSPPRSANGSAAESPSDFMQLFADEASDPRVLNVLQQIRGLEEQQAPPTVLAGAYRALGNLFRDRIEQGEISPSTLQRAMAAYQKVLQHTPETSPMRAEVLNDMGNLSWLLSRCSQGPEQSLPHLHHSIQFYQQALTQIAPETHPQTYPMIQNNLGAAYGDLARYQNPADNLQRSVQAYQEALRYRSADQDPMRYASTQNNLGTTYWNLAQHQDPIHHLKAAITAYDSALIYYKPEQDALNYAMIQNNLGTAYWNLAQHEHSEEWLRQAIKAYELALEYRTVDAAPAAFAATQNNLGTAHWHVANYIDEAPQPRFKSLQQAMRAYEAALQAVEYLRQSDRPTPLNFDVTATQNNLGLVQYQTATDSQFDTSELSETYLNTALEHHLAALQGWQGRPELRQTALNCVIQTLQAIYNVKGLVGQNLALSNVPGQLLPEILPKL
ncbi:MAG: hypothetical protein ACFB5Z_20470 [Elainellaceae cyanobacterium]